MRATNLLLLAFLLSACKANAPASVVAETPAVAPPVVAAEAACPSTEFDGFLEAFIASGAVQKAFTAASVENQTVDPTAEPEPAIITTQVTSADLQYPLIPDKAQQAEQGLSLRQSVLDDGDMKVTVGKADTDQQMSYYFRKGACWQLFRIRNESL